MSRPQPRITLIAAMSENRVIGSGGGLPWRLPADMAHFVRATRGKPVIMGRRNYDDIGRPLPGRTNIVMTRQPGLALPGCRVTHSVDEALQAAGDAPEVMVIGGEAIYRTFLPRAHRIHLTVVRATLDGDTFFPEPDGDWRETAREHRPADADNPYAMDFLVLERGG